ncbi:MAG: MBL fold metallo-hydrolase [Candidatus Yanofskybacteria bacterium]|nr:MBL fold metallo-hydrolase [Candidatus Yanofskybacteria bacterium]
MKLTFYGGARQVTGANYLLELGPDARSGSTTKLLVDCGMFQGSRYAEDLNYEKFPYDPAEINFIFITHSHTDHAGRLPKLYKEGFRGKVVATNATLDLIRKALPDNLRLIEQEAKDTGREPLFSLENLEGVLNLVQGVDYEENIELGGGLEVKLHDAGHILGSSIVEIRWKNKSEIRNPKSENNSKHLYFTGDLGNPPTPLLKSPYYPNDADYVVIESAYGSRTHEDKAERKNILQKIIIETIQRGGVLTIPSFAMERTQELLYELNGLFNDNKIPKVPVFVDSPLATNLTEVYRKHSDYFNKETMYIINSGDDIFNFPGLKFTRTTEESKQINDVTPPKIIIAGSGMSTGGRILHHERRYLQDPNSTILFIGYQVKGSLGRRILDEEKEVKIFGEKVTVNCKVEAIGGYSAHADSEGLLEWVKTANSEGKLKKVFVVQGEEDSSLALARKIERALEIDAVVPKQGEGFEL